MNSFWEYTSPNMRARVVCSSVATIWWCKNKFANPNAVFGDTRERQQSVRAKKLKLDFGMRGAAL